ncbi:MAG: hypothetical protein ACTSUE_07265, partial [Promethearchaeota archaeon]
MVILLALVFLVASTSASDVSVISQNVIQDNWFDAVANDLPTKDSSTMSFPFGCTSNQKCIMDSMNMVNKGLMNAPLPYCWYNGECRGERQLVMQISNPSSSQNGNNTHQATPYPVFHQGEEMCVTVMFNPSIVLMDDLWNTAVGGGNAIDQAFVTDKASLHQERLVLFQSIPLRITLNKMWICSSRKKLRQTPSTSPVSDILPNLMSTFSSSLSGQEEDEQQDVVPHTYIRHRDQSQRRTGCLTNNPFVRKHLIYGTPEANEVLEKEKTLYWSKSGLSSKICFPAKVLGPPDVPCFIDAEVSIQL